MARRIAVLRRKDKSSGPLESSPITEFSLSISNEVADRKPNPANLREGLAQLWDDGNDYWLSFNFGGKIYRTKLERTP